MPGAAVRLFAAAILCLDHQADQTGQDAAIVRIATTLKTANVAAIEVMLGGSRVRCA